MTVTNGQWEAIKAIPLLSFNILYFVDVEVTDCSNNDCRKKLLEIEWEERIDQGIVGFYITAVGIERNEIIGTRGTWRWIAGFIRDQLDIALLVIEKLLMNAGIVVENGWLLVIVIQITPGPDFSCSG